eukprot:TRINITY_DN2725_c0_g1_i1.p1 TRINITY_DN2725_c0_g1~~TRINITY_DN2725_c0_g1_i1.p1  ORF type:complete len:507 (-),score=122.56 TRINITY_DN2725_c0_g1_i1:540-1928(-)
MLLSQSDPPTLSGRQRRAQDFFLETIDDDLDETILEKNQQVVEDRSRNRVRRLQKIQNEMEMKVSTMETVSEGMGRSRSGTISSLEESGHIRISGRKTKRKKKKMSSDEKNMRALKKAEISRKQLLMSQELSSIPEGKLMLRSGKSLINIPMERSSSLNVDLRSRSSSVTENWTKNTPADIFDITKVKSSDSGSSSKEHSKKSKVKASSNEYSEKDSHKLKSPDSGSKEIKKKFIKAGVLSLSESSGEGKKSKKKKKLQSDTYKKHDSEKNGLEEKKIKLSKKRKLSSEIPSRAVEKPFKRSSSFVKSQIGFSEAHNSKMRKKRQDIDSLNLNRSSSFKLKKAKLSKHKSQSSSDSEKLRLRKGNRSSSFKHEVKITYNEEDPLRKASKRKDRLSAKSTGVIKHRKDRLPKNLSEHKVKVKRKRSKDNVPDGIKAKSSEAIHFDRHKIGQGFFKLVSQIRII